jgi:hypothetical protein
MKNSMVHDKLVDDFLARRNLSTCKKPFTETVLILNVGIHITWYQIIDTKNLGRYFA